MALDDSYTVALLHMNGADASTTFTDESGKSWTANGNAQIDTAQSKFGGASGLFDGTGDYISASDSADWQLDGGSNSNKWTIDFWVRFNGDPGTGTQGFIQQRVDNNNFWALLLGNNLLQFYVRSGGADIVLLTFAWNPGTATWNHIAIVKDGTNGYMAFVDGTQVGTTQVDTDPIPDFAGGIVVGNYVGTGGASNYFNGWIDELRISKGVARWVGTFTPPTTEYVPSSSNFLLMF
jgi:hypothetical protein